MTDLARFSVSIERELLEAFDRIVEREGYPTRSEAVKHLVNRFLVDKAWEAKGKVAGAMVMVYDHHKRDVVRKLLNVQHDYGDAIVSTQHVHLDHDNCLEIVTIRGRASRIQEFVKAIRALKGMKQSSLLTVGDVKT